MDPLKRGVLMVAAWITAAGFGSAQTFPTTLDGYLQAAKVAAGTDWAGTFLRLCIPSPAGFQPGLAAVGASPEERETIFKPKGKISPPMPAGLLQRRPNPTQAGIPGQTNLAA